MRLAKRTYALPPDTVARFVREVDSGRRSALVAELIEKHLENKRREAIRRDLEEGCRDMWDVYEDAAKEFEPLDAELDGQLGPWEEKANRAGHGS